MRSLGPGEGTGQGRAGRPSALKFFFLNIAFIKNRVFARKNSSLSTLLPTYSGVQTPHTNSSSTFYCKTKIIINRSKGGGQKIKFQITLLFKL